MAGILIIAHAPFATALRDCISHIYGGLPARIGAIDVTPDCDPVKVVAQANAEIERLREDNGALVLTDMFGATPGNIATQLAQPGRVEVVAGVNLPMLMRTLCYRNTTTIAELPEKALGGGASGMMKIASTAPQNQRPFPSDPNANDGGPAHGPARLQDQ